MTTTDEGSSEKVGSEPRPHFKPDGLPTRSDITLYSEAETAIRAAMLAVEGMGASQALTDAVVLLGQAKERVADHVEGGPLP